MKCSGKMNRRLFIKKGTVASVTMAAGLGLYNCSKNSTKPDNNQLKKFEIGNGEEGSPNRQVGSSAELLPKRVLGKTGMEVATLSFGGGSQFMLNANGRWERLLERALELGVNYFDTCVDYGGPDMMSEERYGEVLSPIRSQVYITSKFNGWKNEKRDTSVMMSEVETSLKRLKTDYLDILMMHELDNRDSLTSFAGGVYKQMLSLKEQGVARNIGFSSMSSATAARDFIKTFEFDACMLAINPTTYGNYEGLAVPEAIKKNMGIMAMKVMRDVVGKNVNGKLVTADELMHWALDRDGVCSAVVGHANSDVFEENVELAKQFKPSLVPKERWAELEYRLRPLAGPHALCWARPDYRDGMLFT